MNRPSVFFLNNELRPVIRRRSAATTGVVLRQRGFLRWEWELWTVRQVGEFLTVGRRLEHGVQPTRGLARRAVYASARDNLDRLLRERT